MRGEGEEGRTMQREAEGERTTRTLMVDLCSDNSNKDRAREDPPSHSSFSSVVSHTLKVSDQMTMRLLIPNSFHNAKYSVFIAK